MRIEGRWELANDGVVRPVIHWEVHGGDGTWRKLPFLVDTGAHRTVFSDDVRVAFALPAVAAPGYVGGVGGVVTAVPVATQVRLVREDGTLVNFSGRYLAMTDPNALDMSVLGRDLLNLFAVIVDRPGDVVCLVGQRHFYSIGTR